MATSEYVNSTLENNWQNTNPEVKAEYGENYFQTFKVCVSFFYYFLVRYIITLLKGQLLARIAQTGEEKHE